MSAVENPTLANAAVFFGGARRYKNIDVIVTPTLLTVHNRANGAEMARWEITDVAKEGEAWDAVDPLTGSSGRLVAQLGCGCSGMHAYKEDPEYVERHVK